MAARTMIAALIPVAAGAVLFPAMTPSTRWRAAAQTAVAPAPARALTEAQCTADRFGTAVPREAIGEPVSSVTLTATTWTAVDGGGYCAVSGTMAPIDQSASARAINFRVVLPASWSGRAIQLGGSGNNGVIPNLTASIDGGANGPARGVVTFGSDSGHQSGPGTSPDWSTNDEAIRNLGFMQMKKTHDAAMVLIARAYGSRPRYTYYVGTSQGGREALTVAQRYPADYDGIIANVPIVSLSTLMLAPELIRIQEKRAANWVTRAKVEAIRGEFLRQCDGLDGLVDGVINNYGACRAIFDLSRGAPKRDPWAAKRCPNDVDPNPADATANACLTSGQIATLQLVYSRYAFATPLANGMRTFGMWVPNTDPSGSGLIADQRFIGQEGAAADARMHSHLGVLGVTGYLMKNPEANPLDYVEGGALNARRVELSSWLDSTDPDLARFERRGGKMLVTIGTDDTLASPGAQLDYYQALVDRMGRATLDRFARLFVIPQANHGLQGRSAAVDGDGRPHAVTPIPNTYDRITLLTDWVERGISPSPTVIVKAEDRTMPLCEYPRYPHYRDGPPESSSSYACRE